jgi:magnesium transporter
MELGCHMISLYCWNTTSRTGNFLDAKKLPALAEEIRSGENIYWIDLSEPTEDEEALVLEQCFPVHLLTLLDITQRHREPGVLAHLPKVEEFPGYLFVIVNPLTPEFINRVEQREWIQESEAVTPVGQISAVLNRTLLITHHHALEPSVRALRLALEKCLSLGQRGPDYLFHLLLDHMVDQFAPILDDLQDSVEKIEDRVLKKPEPDVLSELLGFKRVLYTLRKTLGYEREVLFKLTRGEFDLVAEHEIAYYRNVSDHIIRFGESIERFREMVNDLQNIYLSAASNKLNQIMKVLTIISTVLFPMTLVAGIYGMNFHHMPELHWSIGYPLALGIMALCGVGTLLFFRWKKWI